jgi:hypothetical protein
MIGKLKPVALKEVWAHEAKDFTTWLADNLEVLNEQLKELDLGLVLMEQEKSVGPFSADILAETKGDALVIIENQLTKTDHNHLGQILTYAINTDAQVVLWISPEPRPEHVKVINFLSDNTDIEFHLVRVQAFSIDNSKPAPLFSLVSGSDEATKKGTHIKKALTAKGKLVKKFWTELLGKANEVNKIFSNVSPTHSSWIGATAGKPLTKFELNILAAKARVRLLLQGLSMADEDLAQNNKRCQKLMAKKDDIETAFGAKLVWDFKEGRKNHHVDYEIKKGGLWDEDKWPEIQDAMVAKMDKFASALKPHIKKL